MSQEIETLDEIHFMSARHKVPDDLESPVIEEPAIKFVPHNLIRSIDEISRLPLPYRAQQVYDMGAGLYPDLKKAYPQLFLPDQKNTPPLLKPVRQPTVDLMVSVIQSKIRAHKLDGLRMKMNNLKSDQAKMAQSLENKPNRFNDRNQAQAERRVFKTKCQSEIRTVRDKADYFQRFQDATFASFIHEFFTSPYIPDHRSNSEENGEHSEGIKDRLGHSYGRYECIYEKIQRR